MSWRERERCKTVGISGESRVKPRYMKALSQEIRSILAEKGYNCEIVDNGR